MSDPVGVVGRRPAAPWMRLFCAALINTTSAIRGPARRRSKARAPASPARAGQHAFAQTALDVILLRVAEAAVGPDGALAASKPASAARYLAALASAPQGLPSSYSQAAFQHHQLGRLQRIQHSASGCWMAWFLPIGRSNTTRSFA